MSIAERKERQKQGLRREILDAARELFIKEGYEKVSMRKVAGKIEYSPTTIYLYFKDKTELLDTICGEVFDKLRQHIQAIASQHRDPVKALRAGCRAYVDFGLAHPDHYRVTFMLDLGSFKLDCDRQCSMAMQAFNCLREGVAACVAAGRFRKANVDVAAQAIWAAMHGITALLIAKPGFPWADQDQVINTVLDSMIEGLKG